MSSLLLQRFLPQHTYYPLTCEKPHCPTILGTCKFPFLGSECVIWTLGNGCCRVNVICDPSGQAHHELETSLKARTVVDTWPLLQLLEPRVPVKILKSPVSPIRPYIIQFPITSPILSAYYSCPGSLCSGTLAHQIHSLLRNFTCSFCSFFLEWSSSNISINLFLTPSGFWNVFIMCGLLHIMLCRSFI